MRRLVRVLAVLAAGVTGTSGLGGAALAQGDVRGAPAGAAARPDADKERARALGVLLRDDARLADDPVTVEVTGKNVRLAGEVDTSDEKRHAEELVRNSDPTMTVENLLSTASDATDRQVGAAAEKTSAAARSAGRKASNATREAGDAVSDGFLTSKVKARLMSTDGVDASAINVDTSDQEVTLRGRVKTEAQRRRVLQIARDTKGVLVVVDELTVGPARPKTPQ